MQIKSSARNSLVVLIVIASIFIGALLSLRASVASAQAENPTPLFEDQFDNDKLPGWSLTGNAQQADLQGVSTLRLAYYPDHDDVGGRPARADLQNYAWGAQPFILNTRFWETESDFTVNFQQRETVFGVDRYGVNIQISRGQMSAAFFRQTGKSIANLGEQTETFDENAWHQLEIRSNGGLLNVAIFSVQDLNNPLIEFRYQDKEPLEPGDFSVDLQSGAVYLDSVSILPQEYSFSGAVVQEFPGFNPQPLPNVVVEVYGSNSPWPEGATWLNSTYSDPFGAFTLSAPVGYEYYTIHEINPEGYLSTKADSSLGQVLNSDWVEFSTEPREAPIRIAEIRQNTIFYDFLAPTLTNTPTATETFTPTQTDTPTQTPTATRTATASQTATVTQTATRTTTPTPSLTSSPTNTPTPSVTNTPPPPTPTPPWAIAQCPPAERLVLGNITLSQPAGWQEQGEVSYQNNLLMMNGPARLDYQPVDWQDYQVRLVTVFDQIQTRLRTSSQGSYLIDLSQEQAAIYRVSGGTAQLKAEGIYQPSASLGRYVEAGVQQGRVWVIVDGITVVEWTDPEPLPSGTFGLEVPAPHQVALAALWVCGKPQSNMPLLGLLLVAALGGLAVGGFLFLGRLSGPPDPSRPPRPLPPKPGAPPIRLANAWLTQGANGRGKPLRSDRTLVAGGSYSLHVQIQSRQKRTRQEARQARQSGKSIPLDIVIFTAEGDFAPRQASRVQVTLPPDGSSPAVYLPLQPLRSGVQRVRVGIYHHNVLLQSIFVDMQVTQKRRRQVNALVRGMDYVASARFDQLETLGSPLLSMFTNQAADGMHWVGLFSAAPNSPAWLQQGFVCTFPASNLEALAGRMRSALSKTAGEKLYRMDYDLPPEAAILDLRATDLVNLADTGYRVFDELFFALQDTRKRGYLASMRALISHSGTISIAHCREEGVSFPWAALYDYPLDIDQPESLKLCEVFKFWVEHNTWLDRTHPGTPGSLLDHPQVCRARPDCPLQGPDAGHTVCPFGFWGIRQEVEQPLQLVEPQALENVPPEIKDPAFESTARILVNSGEKVSMGMALYSGFPEASAHLAHFKHLNGSTNPHTPLDLLATFEPEQARQMLRSGGRHLLYFYCHGEEKDAVFRLRVGSPQHPGLISSASLNPLSIAWPEQPQPLVFLNGCESGAFSTVLIHGFFSKLRNLGASGIVGVEIKNWSAFASQFGEILLEAILAGESAGEAFLHARRLFLRQGNPLGLVYSLHGPARLHLHREGNCTLCNPLPQNAVRQDAKQELRQ
jgi:hypothetical protein